MNTQIKQRIFYLDYIKAFAIILVVIGHVLQYVMWPSDYGEHCVWNFIYSFHMPLFMFVSGVTIAIKSSARLSFGHLMKKKSVQLLLPYFAWAIIISLFIEKDILFIGTIIDRPSNGLWFLWDLFFIILLSYIIQLISKRAIILLGGSVVLFIITQLLRIIIGEHFDYSSISYYLVIYNIGVVFGTEKYCQRLIINKRRYFLILLAITIIYLGTWIFYELEKDAFPQSFPTTIYKFIHICNKLEVGIVGSIMFFMLFYLVRNKDIRLFKILDRETLGIYAIHFQLIPLAVIGSTIISASTFFQTVLWPFLILIGSHIAICLIHINKYISLILLGEQTKK